MFDAEKKLLEAERRGRALAIRLKPGAGQTWRMAARADADGAALLAAARWAARFGAEVERAEDSDFGIPLLVTADGLEIRVRHIPSDAEAWTPTLAESWRMVEPATDASLRMSVSECRAVDGMAIGRFGVPGLCLMENASLAALAVARDMLAECGGTRVLIAVGGGNNGGDGLALARALNAVGVSCAAALLKPAGSLSGDAETNFRLLREIPAPIHALHDNPGDLLRFSRDADLVVDALLGTGFKGVLSDSFRAAVDSLHCSGKPVLALDIPSGLNGDTGEAAGVAVTAARTVTFAAIKPGLERGEGPARCGKLYVGDIGAPAEALVPGEDAGNCQRIPNLLSSRG